MTDAAVLTVSQQLLHGDADIPGNLAQQDGREVACGMEWYGRTPAVRMPKLLVRTALTNLLESKPLQNRNDLARLENGDTGHSRYFDGLNSDKLRLDARRAVRTQHLDDFLQISVELIKGGGLRMRTGKAWNISDVQSGIRTTFDHGSISFHKRAPLVSDARHSSSLGLRAANTGYCRNRIGSAQQKLSLRGARCDEAISQLVDCAKFEIALLPATQHSRLTAHRNDGMTYFSTTG